MTVIPFDPRRFRSTAAYYARYRVPYPQALIAAVAARIGLREGDRVLDLGCGPGILGLAFARLGLVVTAMDPEPEMLAEARAGALESGLAMRIVEGSSYDLAPALGRFKLVVMGRSFHWMDRAATLATLDGLVEPQGAVALFHDRRISAAPDWGAVLSELAKTYSPGREENRTLRRHGAPHEAMLLGSAFAAVETCGRVFAQQLSIDVVVGRAFSMSVTSPEALGERRAAFEDELRARLAALAPDGHLSEIVEAVATLALRPAG